MCSAHGSVNFKLFFSLSLNFSIASPKDLMRGQNTVGITMYNQGITKNLFIASWYN